MVSNASGDAASRPMWSMRPRPNIGVCRSASVLPTISKTLSMVDGPTFTKESRMPPSTVS